MLSQKAREPRPSRVPGATMLRSTLPAAIAVLVVLSFLRWLGEDLGLYSTIVGIVLMTAMAIGVIGALLWTFARRLDRDDAARRAVDAQLTHSSRPPHAYRGAF